MLFVIGGPDDSGQKFHHWTISAHDGPVSFAAASGHRRLAILDLNPRSRQPFGNGSSSLLYNGEIYNYQSIRGSLEQEWDFQTTGDTEVLYRLLLDSGTERLAELNGMWAFTLLNETDSTLLASRDRYGKKPLFFYQDDTTLCFSSSIRAIQTYLNRQLTLHRHALLSYLIYGIMYPGETVESHFESIRQILPGQSFHFDLKNWSYKQQSYFDPATKPDLDPDQLVNFLKEAVKSRLISDRPVGLLLSGGVDSSLLLSILCSLELQDQVHVYMGDTGKSEDYHYAKQSADQVGIQARTVKMDYTSTMFDRFLKVCRHHEKAFPFSGNALAMPQMYEAAAADQIPVVLDGTGGDEFFGGYWGRQLPFAIRKARSEQQWKWIHALRPTDGQSIRKHIRTSRVPASLVNMFTSLKPKLSAKRHFYLKAGFREVFSISNPDPLSQVSTNFTSALVKDVSPGGRLGEWVWHNDRNAMMSSVENRSPLLDFRLQTFLFTGYQSKYAESFNKFELRSVFQHFVELPTQWRSQKQGFRWDGKEFIKQNTSQIRELIEASTWLEEFINIPRLVDLSSRRPSILRASLAKRLLCLAGLESQMK